MPKITLEDGAVVNISDESYNEIKKAVTKDNIVKFDHGEIVDDDGYNAVMIGNGWGKYKRRKYLFLGGRYEWEILPYSDGSESMVLIAKRRED